MADRLSLYNDALRMCGERALAAINEDREPRRVLDNVYDRALNFSLSQGDWNFAIRAIRLAESNVIATQWGDTVAYRKPDDWVRTVSLSYSPNPGTSSPDIKDQGGVWITRTAPLYVRYVSNDNAHGGSVGDWPETFAEYFVCILAMRIAPRIRPGNDLIANLAEMAKRALFDAQNKDAGDEGSRTLPLGRLTRARGGGYGRWRENG